MSKKRRIALLFGGRSAEHEVSIHSARAVFSQLDPGRYQVTCLYLNKKGEWREVKSPELSPEQLNSGEFFGFLPWQGGGATRIEADVYFPVLHGPFGEDGTVQGLLEMADAAYVGAAVLASAAGMDKGIAKILFRDAGLPINRFRQIYEENWREHQEEHFKIIRETYSLPLFVKPSNLGSSVGISKIKDWSEFIPAADQAFLYDKKILVEEGIEGRELECSVLGNRNPRASLPGEVVPYREFYDYRDKYLDGKTTFFIPAELPAEVIKEIQRLSVAAFKAVECSGMARVDFFYQEPEHRLYVNEINTIPGFTQISMYPKLWEISGLSFRSLLDELISLALERHKEKKRPQF